jgi:hypothetical protein
MLRRSRSVCIMRPIASRAASASRAALTAIHAQRASSARSLAVSSVVVCT